MDELPFEELVPDKYRSQQPHWASVSAPRVARRSTSRGSSRPSSRQSLNSRGSSREGQRRRKLRTPEEIKPVSNPKIPAQFRWPADQPREDFPQRQGKMSRLKHHGDADGSGKERVRGGGGGGGFASIVSTKYDKEERDVSTSDTRPSTGFGGWAEPPASATTLNQIVGGDDANDDDDDARAPVDAGSLDRDTFEPDASDGVHDSRNVEMRRQRTALAAVTDEDATREKVDADADVSAEVQVDEDADVSAEVGEKNMKREEKIIRKQKFMQTLNPRQR